jgi:rhodanese-related sulfurtransferase
MDQTIKKIDFEFFGSGQHKIEADKFLTMDEAVFLDVRSMEEKGTVDIKLSHHFPSIHIPLNELPGRYNEVPKDKFVGIFCSSGVRSAIAFVYLMYLGFSNVKILPGYDEFMKELVPGKIYKHLRKNEQL